MYKDRISTYFTSLSQSLSALAGDENALTAISAVADEVRSAVGEGRTVFFCGNGGFAAMAQHAASELTGRMRRTRRPAAAVCLNADTAVMTCIANDFGFRQVFSRQLEALGQPGDMLVALSASGTSANIIEVLCCAERMGIEAALITGSGSRDADCLGAVRIVLPAREAAEVQDLAMPLIHLICQRAEEALLDFDRAACWEEILGLPDYVDTLLLDRDGVINRLLPDQYVASPEELVIAPDFLAAAPRLAERFRRIIVVTNQKGIAKGVIGAGQFQLVTDKMMRLTEEAGGRIDAVFMADGTDPAALKPETGMWTEICREFGLTDPRCAVMAGDAASDSLFARKAGINFIHIPALC